MTKIGRQWWCRLQLMTEAAGGGQFRISIFGTLLLLRRFAVTPPPEEEEATTGRYCPVTGRF